ncbi:MAG: hypothetical protein HQL69_19180 [Magnetococcales bacterium]|nr:hypothetical protein [Magnetococcales bacterium]
MVARLILKRQLAYQSVIAGFLSYFCAGFVQGVGYDKPVSSWSKHAIGIIYTSLHWLTYCLCYKEIFISFGQIEVENEDLIDNETVIDDVFSLFGICSTIDWLD